jgi:hypothetical protein
MSENQEKDVSNSEDKPRTVWELYNAKAKIRDREMLKDWEYNIRSLLLFVRLNDVADLILTSSRI